ncbi:DUF5425 family lipoprotein [Borreliella carolinensis]|uniref:DUF5425 family lipoprotein n=1 Tax=Borreliella carolinensis TaxID=478174 RepID=A0ABZ0MKR3_9SPIR|nr:DUF5425 family lipoprotein [Borreliella carolinensis]WOY07570.1 DUF5425 family lipoprotein [Borreliella carolinensis]
MSKKFAISFLSIILNFLSVLSCDLSINTDKNKIDRISNFEEKYMNDLDYQCLSKKESSARNSQIKLSRNNNGKRFYSSRISNISNHYDKTHTFCKRK